MTTRLVISVTDLYNLSLTKKMATSLTWRHLVTRLFGIVSSATSETAASVTCNQLTDDVVRDGHLVSEIYLVIV